MESVWRKRQSEGKKGNFSEIFAVILQVYVWRERGRERERERLLEDSSGSSCYPVSSHSGSSQQNLNDLVTYLPTAETC